MNSNQLLGNVGAFWGIAGVSAILSGAIYRLSVITIDGLSQPLSWYHWLSALACVLFMAYSEGYKGFQLQFSPRVAARSLYLRDNPTPLYVLLAPLFCMGYFHTTRKRQITSIVITLLIICIVQLAHMLIQPWRGILDLGVVVGLTWGLVSLLAFAIAALTRPGFSYSPELPEP